MGLLVLGVNGLVNFGQQDCGLVPRINETAGSLTDPGYLKVNGSSFQYGKSLGTYFCAMKVQDGKLQKDWLVTSLDFWSDDSRINGIQVGYRNNEQTEVIGTKSGDHSTMKWDPATQTMSSAGTDPKDGNLKSMLIAAVGGDSRNDNRLELGPKSAKLSNIGGGTLVGVDGFIGTNGVETLGLYFLNLALNQTIDSQWS